MNNKLFFFLIFNWLCFTCAIPAMAQRNYYFDKLNANDGLLDDIVYEVFQDNKGYIWLGTIAGIQRYDGHDFKNFTFNPHNGKEGIHENIIRCISQLSDGSIWFGTEGGGIIRYKDGHILPPLKHDPKNSNSLAGNVVEAIVQSDDGTIWIGTNEGLNSYKDDHFRVYRHDSGNPNSLIHNRIHSLCLDQNDELWIGTKFGLGILTRNGKFKKLVHDPADPGSIGSNFIHDIDADLNGNVWLSTVNGGLNRVNTTTLQVTRYQHDPDDPETISSDVVLSSVIDQNNMVWSGTWGGGLNRFDGKSFVSFQHNESEKESISGNNIEDVEVDNKGNIWTAHYLGGVNRYSRKTVNTYLPGDYRSEGMLSLRSSETIYISEDHTIWIATNEGANSYKNGKFTTYQANGGNSLSINRINTIFQDSRNNVWFGTLGTGIDLLSRGRFENFRQNPDNPYGMDDNNISGILEDLEGNIWISGFDNGLFRYSYDSDQFTAYRSDPANPTNTLINNQINGISISQNGKIWIATRGGLSSFHNGVFENFVNDPSNPESLPKNSLKTVYADGQDNVWVGFSGGVAKLDYQQKTFRVFTKKEGLAGPMVEKIFGDKNGDIWVVTHDGASKFDESLNSFISYTSKNGFIDERLVDGNSSPDGKVYFLSNSAFYFLDPDKLASGSGDNQVTFTDFTLRSALSPALDSLVQGQLINREEITLNYDQASFSISFSTLDGDIKSNQSYLYRMNENSWTFLGEENNLNFNNLEPGNYEIEVKTPDCANEDCVARQTIEIKSPWWEMLWFRIIMVFVLLLIAYLIYSFRVRSLTRQRVFLRKEVSDKTGSIRSAVGLLKSNIRKVYESGTGLKTRSGHLSDEVKEQTETARELENDIENILLHTKKNNENVSLGNDISQKIMNQVNNLESVTKGHLQGIQTILEKTRILEEIFRQTNILAINASIEAASAGAAGQGFSVIAREIKVLAEKSEIASKEIQDSSEKGVAETREVSELIINFIPEIERSVNILQQITQSGVSQNDSIESMRNSLTAFLENIKNNAKISEDIYNISTELEEFASYLDDQARKIDL